jgi:hypothetical protein
MRPGTDRGSNTKQYFKSILMAVVKLEEQKFISKWTAMRNSLSGQKNTK